MEMSPDTIGKLLMVAIIAAFALFLYLGDPAFW